MVKTLVLGLLAATAPLLAAHAAPATPEEAARLTALFERYVGSPAPGTPGSVTVVPQGDGYVATFDLKRALSGFEALGFSIEPNLSSTTLTPLPDGTWKVAADQAPPIVMHVGAQTITMASATTRFDGIYDPKLYGFRQSTSVYTGYDFAQTSPKSVQDRRIDRLVLDLKGVPADGGTVDVAGRYAATGLAADMEIKPAAPADLPAPGNPAVQQPKPPSSRFSYASPSGTIDVALKRFDTKGVLDIWAFLVAHPNRDSLIAVEDQFKGMLRAALPPMDSLQETAAFDSFAVTTPIGPFTMRKLAGGLDLQGLGGTGKMASSLSFEDLTVPAGQLPGWSANLVPTAMSLALGVDGFHAKEAAIEAVGDYDPKVDGGLLPDQSTKVGHLFWPESGGTLTIMPSRLTSKLLDVRFEGHAALGTLKSGSVTVTATGLDKAIAALQAASGTDPSASQMLGPLVLAKNLAKPQPDGSLLWVIAADGTSPITVNGAPLR